jgi:predicted nucleic acid-binding protein
MNVLVDTSVWSLALRRSTPRQDPIEGELRDLILEGRVLLVGPVRQELLTGIRAPAQFRKLRDVLAAFPDEPITREDYEDAASCFNRCRARGIQGSNTDFLLCAIALRLGVPLFTTDRDFDHFAKVLRVHRHAPRTDESA